MRNQTATISTRRVPAPIVVEWPISAADWLYVRGVLAEHPRLEYGLHVHDDAATPHVHVVFFRRPDRTS